MTHKGKIDIDNKQKIDILQSLMESFRSQIMFWHDRAYIAATASFALLLTIAKLWIDTLNKTIDTQRTIDILNKAIGTQKPTIDILNKTLVSLKETIGTPKMILLCAIYVIVILLIEMFTQIYLEAAENAYKGNEECKVKCEYALRLKEDNYYLDKGKFFWAPQEEEKDRGMPAKDISSLRKAHRIFAGVLVAGCVASLCIYHPEILLPFDSLRFFVVAIVGFITGVTSTVWVYWSKYDLSVDCLTNTCTRNGDISGQS